MVSGFESGRQTALLAEGADGHHIGKVPRLDRSKVRLEEYELEPAP